MAESMDTALHGRITELARSLARKRGLQEGYAQQDWQAAENQVMEELSLTQGTAWKAEQLLERPASEGMARSPAGQAALGAGATRDETESGAFKNEYLGR